LYDISIGYKLPGNLLEKLHLHDAQFSLSGQNLWTLYSKADDSTPGAISTRGAVASITVTF
jgi:hypothetical protein